MSALMKNAARTSFNSFYVLILQSRVSVLHESGIESTDAALVANLVSSDVALRCPMSTARQERPLLWVAEASGCTGAAVPKS
jgi:hypothetical protein